MDLKTTALALGLPSDASEQQVTAELAENKRKALELEALKASNAQSSAQALKDKVKAALDKAIVDKRILADAKGAWELMLTADFETANSALEAIAPIVKAEFRKSTHSSSTYEGKTFEDLQDDPEALAELEINDKEAFDRLFADYRKRNKIK